MSVFAGIAACLALPARTSAPTSPNAPGRVEVGLEAAASTLDGKRPEGRMLRGLIVMIWMGLVPLGSAVAQVSVQIALPGVSIGINQPVYPQLIPVPGYPVYYDPGAGSNYFFYDGMYWVYAGDSWYASSWYNGPWALVGPQAVPVFILRVPVRYYRHPPAYFHGWGQDAPPRWGEHWGNDWERHRSGWDRWERNAAPPPAPLPVYQKQYSGNRYPQAEQQHAIRNQNYQYKPRDAEVKQVYKAQPASRQPQQASPQPARPAPQQQQASPQPAQRENKGEQPGRNKQQEQAQPASRQPQQASPQPARPAPQQQQASPQPAQRENKGEQQPGRNKQQEQAQSANRQPQPQQASPPPARQAPQQQQVRAPESDKGSKGKSGEQPKGNASQAKGDEHGSDRKN
jgi:hypothetical protein